MSKADKNCPNGCGQLSITEFAKTDIDVCKTCIGVWLDYGEVASILRNSKPDWSEENERKILRRFAGYNRPPLFEERALRCPHCDNNLDEVNYQGTSNIVVNPCISGHGLWLDRGELLAIRVYLNHWAKYALTHKEEIENTLSKIERDVSEWEKTVVNNTRASIPLLNGLVNEVLKQMDR